MIVEPGPGRRNVLEDVYTVAEKMRKNTLEQQSPSSMDIFSLNNCFTTVEKKPVLLLADSMGSCIRQDDDVIAPVVKTRYNYDWMANDVVEGVVSVQRYKNIIIWAGAHVIHDMDINEVEADLKGLVNVIVPRNRKAMINVSTLIPKPRENHLTQDKFAWYNSVIKNVVLDFQKAGQEVFCLKSDTIFLDQNSDIVRPITANFDDGFHLNPNGAQKLRQYWLENLKSS